MQEATLIYQLENLRFAMAPEQLDKALRIDVPRTNFNKDFNNKAGKPLNINLVAADIVSSYRWIYRNYSGMKGKRSLAEVKRSPHYANFTTRFAIFMKRLETPSTSRWRIRGFCICWGV